VDAAPAKAVAADANAVPQRLAIGQHEVKPPLGGIYENGARRVSAFKSDGLPRDRAGGADAEIGAAAHDIAAVNAEETLGTRAVGAGQQCQHRKQQSKDPGHILPREKSF
jgi:hypothetical protein